PVLALADADPDVGVGTSHPGTVATQGSYVHHALVTWDVDVELAAVALHPGDDVVARHLDDGHRDRIFRVLAVVDGLGDNVLISLRLLIGGVGATDVNRLGALRRP